MRIRTCSVLAFGVAIAFCASPATAVAQTASAPVTFSKDVAPIFQQKCQQCHEPGSIAPMSLITFEEARPWARAIKERVSTRNMPPWHIDRTVGIQKFKNDMSLTDQQIDTIVRWVDAGAPQGNPKDMPAPKPVTTKVVWRAEQEGFGAPDIVVTSDPYTMPARHQDVWWRPVSEIPIAEPRWVKLVEMRPTTLKGRQITHHAVAYLAQDNDPESVNTNLVTPRTIDLNDLSGMRSMLMEWAVGKGYDLYRPDTGKLLLPGSKISWDTHLHAVGEDVTSSVEIGIWFYPKGQEPKHRTYLVGFQAMKGARGLDITPNAVSQTEGFTILKKAAIIANFQPHMHLRGKAMSVEAILPNGRTEVISYIKNFNFNWMTNYIYADDAAPAYPAGTIIHVTAWHDNTKANKNNPDPEQWVGSGDRTVDEMAHAWMNVTFISDDEYATWQADRKKAETTTTQQQQ